MLNRRLQLLIDEERYRRIAGRARELGVSVASVIRDAIDTAVPGPSDAKRKAADAILAAAPMSVPEPDELKRELDELRGRRG